MSSDGHGGKLYAWIGSLTQSADSHNELVFFFDGTSYLGTDTSTPSPEIDSVSAPRKDTVDVVYASYKSTDPLCCPSGHPVTIAYRLNGRRMTASRKPPGH